MSNRTEITVYGTYWCPDCRRSKQLLGEHQIPYRWINIEEDKDAERYVQDVNQGRRMIPTIEFADGSILVEPTDAELAAKLGLKTTAEQSHYDLIIVGGGPAGLTAALYAARERIGTLVIERAALGGQAATTQWLDNVPGFADGIEGTVFAQQLARQARRFGVEMLQAQQVTHVRAQDGYHWVETADGSVYSAHALLLTTGSRYRRLGVPGEESYVGAGVHFCATCDGPFYKGKEVVVVGGGNSATEESLFLLRFVQRVTMLVRSGTLKASQILSEKVCEHPDIDIRYHTQITAFHGHQGKLESVIIQNDETGTTETLWPAAVFVFIGQTPNTQFLTHSGIVTNRWGYIVTGHAMPHGDDPPAGFKERDPFLLETSVPGVFAAGDVRSGSTKQVAAAAGEGVTAALMIREYLRSV